MSTVSPLPIVTDGGTMINSQSLYASGSPGQVRGRG
jgi:hypothetical protein